jgi:hypothetical protein
MSLIVLDAEHALSFDKLEQWALAESSVLSQVRACVPRPIYGLDRILTFRTREED